MSLPDILNALLRQASDLESLARQSPGYSGELPSEDARLLRQAHALLASETPPLPPRIYIAVESPFDGFVSLADWITQYANRAVTQDRALRTPEAMLRAAYRAMGYPDAESWSSGDCMAVYIAGVQELKPGHFDARREIPDSDSGPG